MHGREQEVAAAACRAAGLIVMEHYARDQIEVTRKDDDSPVTRADLAADGAICSLLAEAFPDDAVLSEESTDDAARLGLSRVWIVDPLDGTRDFVERTGDFCVHVALAIDGAPAVACVYQPVDDLLCQARAGGGAFAEQRGERTPLRVSPTADMGRLRTGVSRLSTGPALARFLAGSPLAQRVVRRGASTKMLALARGDLEVCVCLGVAEKEWDTCAPGLIVEEAGGTVTDLDGRRFAYNRADVRHARGILMSNGPRHDELLEHCRPYLDHGP